MKTGDYWYFRRLYTRFICTYGLAISSRVREYTDTERENNSDKRKGIFKMAKAFDAGFYIEALTGDLKTIAHPNPDISREVRKMAFESARETLKALAENGAGEFYRRLHADVANTDKDSLEFDLAILKDIGRKIWNKELRLPKA